MTIKAYYVRYDSNNYPILEMEHKEGGNSEVDVTEISLSRSHDSIFDIGTDVSIGYLDESESFVAEFNGDITAKETYEMLIITVESYGGRINRTEHITKIYDDKSPEYIVDDLVDTYTDGLTYASSSSSGSTITKFVMNSETAGEGITRILNELNWQIRVDNSKNFYFEPKGEQVSSINLTVGTNAFMDSNWIENPTQLINDVTIIGDNAKFQTNKTIASGDGQTDFVVDHIIVGNVRVTVEGVEVTGGQISGTVSYDYTVDKENKTIIFSSGQTLNDSVIIYYEYEIPIKVSSRNDVSIAAHGRFPKRFTDKTLTSMSQARSFARKIVNLYSEPIKSGNLTLMWDADVSVGETINIVDSFSGIDQEFVILKKTKKYPDGVHTIEVGVEELDILNWNKTMDGRVKNLEAKQDSSDLLQKYLMFKENLNVITRQGRVRTRTQNIYNGSYDSFILGHPTNGRLGVQTGVGGTGIVLGDYRSAWVVQAVTNPNDIMYERFNFTTYDDTGSTTATWDTTNEQCTFTSAEIAVSLAVAKRATNYTSATLTADSTTNLAFHLSADGGSHWESATSGTSHTFVVAGKDLRWKATASGNATLGEIKIEY